MNTPQAVPVCVLLSGYTAVLSLRPIEKVGNEYIITVQATG